jgi:hypothetical protein
MGLFSGLGKVLGVAGSIGGLIPGLGAVSKLASIGGGLLSGADRGGKADKLQSQRKGLADERYAAGAPFRSKLQALAARGPAQQRDLSSIFADPGNPYARVVPRPIAPQGNTAMPLPLPVNRPRRSSPLSSGGYGSDREMAVY